MSERLKSLCISTGKCVVSSFKDFLSCRPTEYVEEEVLVCESRYIESEKQMKKFKGLKRFSLSGKVVEDEVYYFRYLCEKTVKQHFRLYFSCVHSAYSGVGIS